MKLELHQLEEKYAGMRVHEAARERRLGARRQRPHQRESPAHPALRAIELLGEFALPQPVLQAKAALVRRAKPPFFRGCTKISGTPQHLWCSCRTSDATPDTGPTGARMS